MLLMQTADALQMLIYNQMEFGMPALFGSYLVLILKVIENIATTWSSLQSVQSDV